MTILNAVGTGESEGSPLPALPRTALWLAAFVAASFLGRTVVVQPENVGVVWPAAGVALAWLGSSTRQMLPLDLVLVSVSGVVVLALTEGGVARSVLSLSVVLQALLALWLLRRWVPGIWGAGGREPFTRLAQFGWILASVGLAAFVLALLRSLIGSVVLENEGFDMLAGRFGRQASALMTIGVFGLLAGGWLAQRRDRGLPLLTSLPRREALHLLAIEAATALVFVVFWRNPEIPTTYVLSLSVVWTAIRFNPVITGVHCLLTGLVTVWMTILGYGPLSNVSAPDTRALLAQVFVVVLMVTGMTISLIRRQVTETISRLEESETKLAMRAEELDLVMSHLEDGIAIIEAGGRVVHANAALLTAFGSRPAQPLEKVPEPHERKGQAYHPDGRPLEDVDNPYLRAMKGETVDAEEIHHIDEDGVFRVLEVSAFPVPNPTGVPRRAMLVIRDATAASNYRESLVSFAGTVAHDLNNPLSVIDGWAEALQEDLIASGSPESTRAASMVQHIRASVEQARRFIASLLAHSVSRDQALECEHVSLLSLVKHIVNTRAGPRAGAEIVAGDLVDVWADRVLLRQVLDNLVGNAIKYVAPGTTPHVLIEAEPLEDGWAKVTVRDNGIGVPSTQRERIFETFHRATEGYQGTGLGLAICKRIIERHGGTIRVVANPEDVGSCFEFTLPTTPEALARATSTA